MASFFDFVKAPALKKYEYNLNHECKFSGKVGQLIPFHWDILSPGDSIKFNASQFLRTAPMVHPIFQRMNVDVHHFFVPFRLIWSEFEDFITGYSTLYNNPVEINHPKVILDPNEYNLEDFIANFQDKFNPKAPIGIGTLADYLGIPVPDLYYKYGLEFEEDGSIVSDGTTLENGPTSFSALPFRAYTQIFNDYYRDAIKEDIVQFSKGSADHYLDGDNTDPVDYMQLRSRAYSKDYFTTAQPNPQLGDSVSVNFDSPASGSQLAQTANLSTFAITTINKLRELFSTQKWRDTGNKFGSRYKEQVLGHFGVNTPDARLQRAQFLGGGRIPLMINQVSQLSAGTEDSPLGYQAGQGMASGAGNYIEYDCLEHGIFMSFISVLPEISYYRGISRKFKLYDRFDFPFPEFATIGEQSVLSQELNVAFDEEDTYGYQERYAEFKTSYNRVMGEFRSNLRDFYITSPQERRSCLDSSNIRPIPSDLDNVFAVDSSNADNVYFLISNDFTKYTPLPYINRVTTDYV